VPNKFIYKKFISMFIISMNKLNIYNWTTLYVAIGKNSLNCMSYIFRTVCVFKKKLLFHYTGQHQKYCLWFLSCFKIILECWIQVWHYFTLSGQVFEQDPFVVFSVFIIRMWLHYHGIRISKNSYLRRLYMCYKYSWCKMKEQEQLQVL
jgi:hypothetical protein